ncbi:hypothetical protein HID58_055626 [Brassica napus]|uniref:Uncharacterized protein n=1 Tax=Brassica napus TaxID=3708 RepID=A0ABQ8ALT2_BRANA|nr:hypothetical protein HID58_055626 [Brassica napus]
MINIYNQKKGRRTPSQLCLAASVKAASDLDSKHLMMSLPEIVRLLKRKAKAEEEASEFVISSNRRPGVRHSTFESLRLGLSSQSIASGILRFWDSLNFKKDREFVGITVLFLDEKANSSGMTYQQLKLVISQQLIPYFPYLEKSTVFLIYFFIYATLASVMDSSLPRIALTMVSGKKKILLLKKDCDNPVNSPFQTEQQMEANFSGSSSTSRQNQKIDVGGSLIKGILQRSETA